jgi:hypothetical protein
LILSPKNAKLAISTKKKEGATMATKLYTIPDLLIGKEYRSRNRHFEGEIISAEPRPEIWYGDNTEAYLIGVNYKGSIRTKYATIAVKVGD